MLNQLFRHDHIMQRLFPAMVFSSALAVVLLFYRIERTSAMGFAFLLWNLFLAWIPFFLSLALRKEVSMPKWARAGVFIMWLLFLPNAPYILTDLLHLHQRPNMPLWFDMLLILAFAWSGLMLGLASLLNVHLFMQEHFGKLKAWAGVLAIQALCGFGIYLGRFLRWNSWDALLDPLPVLKASFHIIASPLSDMHATGFTIIFSGFLMVSYLFFAGVVSPRGDS